MVFESTDALAVVRGRRAQVPPPLSSYGFQKLAVEYFARAAWDQYQLPYTIVRPFNCVGIGERRALGDVEIDVGQRQAGDEPRRPRPGPEGRSRARTRCTSSATGDQVRHYTYGGDLARASSTAMEHPAALNEDFNLSTAESTTVLELAEVIWRKIKGRTSRSASCTTTPFEHDVQRRVPRSTRPSDVLGFEATTTLDEMLDEVIPWIRHAIEDGTI